MRMNISERITRLRKARGITQEELAEVIGVSRQAVSKWESEQSAPDLDKIVALSEYFGVTTDYILKGVEVSPPEPSTGEKKENAATFVGVSTMLNFLGLFITCITWHVVQSAGALIIAAVFLAVGCMVFAIGMQYCTDETRQAGKYNFWRLNIWLLLFMPMSVFYNFLSAPIPAPYPLLASPLWTIGVFWAVYIGVCTVVTVMSVKAKRRLTV